MSLKKYASFVGLLGVLGVLITACTPAEDPAIKEGADLILSGTRIFTSNTQQPWAEAVAIKNGRFIYVGDSAGASSYRSNSTRFITLEGRLVIPGLVDSHAHPG